MTCIFKCLLCPLKPQALKKGSRRNSREGASKTSNTHKPETTIGTSSQESQGLDPILGIPLEVGYSAKACDDEVSMMSSSVVFKIKPSMISGSFEQNLNRQKWLNPERNLLETTLPLEEGGDGEETMYEDTFTTIWHESDDFTRVSI